MEAQGFSWLGIAPEHAWAVVDLLKHHGDPFDRLLIAQAMRESATVITGDPAFRAYDVEVCLVAAPPRARSGGWR